MFSTFTLESDIVLGLLNVIISDLFDKFDHLVNKNLQYKLSSVAPISCRIIVLQNLS